MGTMTKSYAPGILLATPTLTDPNFSRTVVLLFHHDEKGSMGLIVNRPSERRLGEVLAAAGLKSGDPAVPGLAVCQGGPVVTESGWVVFEGTDPRGQSFDLGDGMRVTGSLDVFKDLLKRRAARRMLFALGYAGWGPGQLDMEMEAGAWIPVGIDRSLLFEAPFDERWRRGFQAMGIDPNLWSMVPGDG
jgi:putative transcriptional regulator